MKSIWTGAIGFGLVNIPVKLYSGSQDSRIDLDLIDKKDHARIHYQRVNEETGEVVEWKNIVKGYSIKGGYVVLNEDDFAKASPEKSKVIAIDTFVDDTEIESVYYEVPYFLEPTKAGERAYILMRDALKKSGKAGIGSFVLRNKEHLCVIKPYENILMLCTMRFAQEIRKTSELKIPKKTKVKPGELKMALSLIDQLSTSFDISEYKDTYRASLMKLIETKAKGGRVTKPKMKVTHRKPKDLMAQLKASLKAAS